MGRRGPAGKSPEEKKLAGTRRKGREAAAAPAVPPTPATPEPPVDALGKIGLACWNRTVKLLADQGLMAEDYRDALACYCAHYERWILAEKVLRAEGLVFVGENGYTQQRPEVSIASKAMEAMRKFQVEFGLTPKSRNGVKRPKGGANEPKNPFTGV